MTSKRKADNETLERRIGSGRVAREDYALRKVPPTWRYNRSSIILTLLGGATAGVFLAFPAQLASEFGVYNVIIGIAYIFVIQTLLNYVFVRAASRTGLSSDLMTRGLALGFDGSAWTTVIYWVAWVTFFAAEGEIIASAVTAQMGISESISKLLVGLVFLPLVVYGLEFMAKFQKWTLYLYILGMAVLIATLLFTGPSIGSLETFYESNTLPVGGLGLLGVLAAYNGILPNVLFGHADVARLLANKESLTASRPRDALWISLIPYSFFAYVLFGFVGLYLWAATGGETDPGLYFVGTIGVFGFLLIVLTQVRINLINAYSGSLSMANFFSRLHYTPGRPTWAVIMVVVGTVAMYLNILDNLGTVLTFQGVFLFAWIGVVLSDLVLVRGKHGHGPDGGQFIEYRRSMLPHWNHVGVIPLAVSTATGLILAFGGQNGMFGGTVALNISSWVALVVAAFLTWVLGVRDGGRSYAIRPIIAWPRSDVVVECPLDHEVVSTDDLFPCPFHEAWICSEDCMGTKDCKEKCKSMGEELQPCLRATMRC
jgi:purine-cytosine permease-like protein